MKLYSVFISIAAVIIFLGSNQVTGSNLSDVTPEHSMNTKSNADHRSLLLSNKKKTRTRFYRCKLNCLNKKKKCKKRCTTKEKNNRAFCWNGHLPKKCQPCCKKEDDANNGSGSGTGQIHIHSYGEFSVHRDKSLVHTSGKATRGSACHPGCKRYRASAYSNNSSYLACGGENDTGSVYWTSNNPTDCRITIPYCRHYNHDTVPCKWEIKEKCK